MVFEGMARPLRYETPGAVYHVMARGDGGKDIFEEDSDRFAWMELMERVCMSFGWRVHAWVLMGNHFHLLLETPEPNLVSGMKWFLGVFSQGWNRRRKRRGHVFQGRYKAVVVNGEEREGCYFRIVADYIHLNPVRAGMAGGATTESLRSYRWSSFPYYARGKGPAWLHLSRVLEAFRLNPGGLRGGRSYAGYLEARAKDFEGALNDDALKELRRGWYLGEKGFGDKILAESREAIRPKRRKGSVGEEAARAHDIAEAERVAMAALQMLELPTDGVKLTGRGRWTEEKALIASLIRKRTGVRNRWIALRLGMGHEIAVTRALRWLRDSRTAQKRLKKLEASLD